MPVKRRLTRVNWKEPKGKQKGIRIKTESEGSWRMWMTTDGKYAKEVFNVWLS